MHALRTVDLAAEFYRQAKQTQLPFYLKDQLQRASLSVVLNLAEGWGRKGAKDRVRFFYIALGSMRECQAIMKVEWSRFNDKQRDIMDRTAASIYKLIQNTR